MVVNYAVTDDQIVFRLPEYSEICQYAPGREITLDVSCVCAGTRTEVVVTGVGFVPDHRADLLGSVDLVEEWPPGISTHLICLDLTVVEGTRGVVPAMSGRVPAEPRSRCPGGSGPVASRERAD